MKRSRHLFVMIIGILLLLAAGTAPAEAQPVVVRPGRVVYSRPYYWRTWGYYGPGDIIATRVAAQAELIRASGGYLVNREIALRIRADTVKQNIENAKKRVEAYWTIREINESGRLKEMGNYLRRRKRLNELRADLEINHPELNRLKIASGESLNWLLYRLSGSVLAYRFSSTSSSSSSSLESLDELKLSPKILGAVRLRQKVSGGSSLVFRANDTKPETTNWPFALMADELKSERYSFQKTRTEVMAKDKLGINDVRQIDTAMMSLRNRFDTVFTREKRMERGMTSWQEWKMADLYLKDLAGEVGRLKQTRDTRLFRGNVKFDGDNVVDLLKFMARHGLEFHDAETGDEWAYFSLHKMMRDMYAVVVSEDAGAKTNIDKK